MGKRCTTPLECFQGRHVRGCPLFIVPTPTLDALVAEGKVKWDVNAYAWLGQASDGVWVQIGHDAISAEKYLKVCPTPEKW
jgi:hypothetical protein